MSVKGIQLSSELMFNRVSNVRTHLLRVAPGKHLLRSTAVNFNLLHPFGSSVAVQRRQQNTREQGNKAKIMSVPLPSSSNPAVPLASLYLPRALPELSTYTPKKSSSAHLSSPPPSLSLSPLVFLSPPLFPASFPFPPASLFLSSPTFSHTPPVEGKGALLLLLLLSTPVFKVREEKKLF